MTKVGPTATDTATLAEYGNKANSNRALLQTLDTQYTNEVQTMMGDLQEKTLNRVREVVRNLAAKQGYTIVFNVTAAPYAANDLTEEAAKVLKK